jgi:hypothetical protein
VRAGGKPTKKVFSLEKVAQLPATPLQASYTLTANPHLKKRSRVE